jgi:hypothetical protein
MRLSMNGTWRTSPERPTSLKVHTTKYDFIVTFEDGGRQNIRNPCFFRAQSV